jgi:hypothetical protein
MYTKSGYANEVNDEYGELKYFTLYIDGYEFKFDKRTMAFFIEFFDEGACFSNDGYLAKRVGGKIVQFHRAYKFQGVENDLTIVVHHRNGETTDNRSTNLIFMNEQEHKDYHEKRRTNIQENYAARGERMRKAYEERGERMRAKYEERGRKIRERYAARGERMRAKFKRG